MMIWSFINGWQKRSFRQASAVLLLIMVYTLSGAQNNQTEQPASVLLLEMLGQFEMQDEAWLDNEIKQSVNNASDVGSDKQNNISEKVNE